MARRFLAALIFNVMQFVYSLIHTKRISTLASILLFALAAKAQDGQLKGIVKTSDNGDGL